MVLVDRRTDLIVQRANYGHAQFSMARPSTLGAAASTGGGEGGRADSFLTSQSSSLS